MSDVIRNAIVKLGIQLSNPNLKLPDLNPAIKQQKDLAAATRAAATATKEAQVAVDKSKAAFDRWQASVKVAHGRMRDVAQEQRIAIKTTAELDAMVKMEAGSVAISTQAKSSATAATVNLTAANVRSADAYRRAAVGALGVAKGLAFVAAGQSDALSKALPYLFITEGILQAAKGLVVVEKALAAAYVASALAAGAAATATQALAAATAALLSVLTPIRIAFLAIAAVVALYVRYVNQAAAAEQARSAAQERMIANSQVLADAEFKRIELIRNITEKEKALRTVLRDGNGPDNRLQAARQLLDLHRQQSDAAKKSAQDQVELIRLKEKELNTARDALKVENERQQSLAASIGALNARELQRLKRLLDKDASGVTLTKREASEVERLGGNEGAQIAAKTFVPIGREIAEQLSRQAAKASGENPAAKAKAEFDRAQESFNRTTGGKGATDAIRRVEQSTDRLADSVERRDAKLVEFMNSLINRIEAIGLEQNRAREASR